MGPNRGRKGGGGDRKPGPLAALSDLVVLSQLGRAPAGTGEIATRAVEEYSEEGGQCPSPLTDIPTGGGVSLAGAGQRRVG